MLVKGHRGTIQKSQHSKHKAIIRNGAIIGPCWHLGTLHLNHSLVDRNRNSPMYQYLECVYKQSIDFMSLILKFWYVLGKRAYMTRPWVLSF